MLPAKTLQSEESTLNRDRDHSAPADHSFRRSVFFVVLIAFLLRLTVITI
jgi:hypothetical protein